MVKEKGGAGEETAENLGDFQPSMRPANYFLSVALTCLSNANPSAFMGIWASFLLGLSHHYPSPLVHPQLQQTEAELRKMDEAIALFQKML